MKKKFTYIFIGIILILITSAVFLFKSQITNFLQNKKITATQQKEKDYNYEKFLILPSDYILSNEEQNYILTNNFSAIFFLESTTTLQIASSTTDFLATTTVKTHLLNDNSEYKICNKKIINESERYELYEYELVYGNCAENAQLKVINEVKCLSTLNECQSELFGLFHKEDIYLFVPEEPFLTNFIKTGITVEEVNGLVKIIWDDSILPLNLIQNSYSLEYLNNKGERIDAFGLVFGQNYGDIYIPRSEYVDKDITIKLRIWYSHKDVVFTTPDVITRDFRYKGYISPIIEVENSNQIYEEAWIPEWGSYDGMVSIQKNPSKWSVISPTWYIPNSDGTLSYQYSYYNNELESVIKSNGIKLIPTIMLFDADILREILRNNMDNHINSIVNEVNICGYDGIDLDYESTYMDDKDLLVEFVTKLTEKLHENGKIITFTALSKIDDRQIYSSFPQTHQAQDWKRIGEVVDEFRIMAYDYTAQSSKKAGPMSPIIWNDAIIQYAINNVPKEKIVLALPLYSHAWQITEQNPVGDNNDITMYLNENNSLSWQHDDIDYIRLNSTTYNESHNDWYEETFVSLNYNGIFREMYYLSPSDIEIRKELARSYGIKGVCYWRIGGDQV